MKLTQEIIREIIKEETENVLRENLLEKIKNFFKNSDPFEGNYENFKKDQKYPRGSYGEFAQSTGIVQALKKKNVQLKKDTISTAGQAMIGTGDSNVGTVIGLSLAIAGLLPALPVAAATAIGYAGLSAATIGFIKMFRKNPGLADEYPMLTAFQMDKELIEIIDDRLESQIIDEYEDFFIDQVRKNPAKPMRDINFFARDWLIKNKNKRTVTGFVQWKPIWKL